MTYGWLHSAEGNNDSTILPLAMYDEGLGAPSGKTTNPDHASFSIDQRPNCYVESRINKIKCKVTFSLTKGAVETDKVVALRFAYMPIHTAFKENLDIVDEATSLTIKEILELQSEDTDRQCYPLWNGTKMVEKFSGSATLNAAVPGLTTNQIIEAVDFNEVGHYRAMQYYTFAKKYMNLQSGLKWITLTKTRPTFTTNIYIKPNVKRMNKYGFFGLLVHVPQVGTDYQIPIAGDTTAIDHIACDVQCNYNEWNENFDFERV